MISHLRVKGMTLIYNPGEHTLRASTHGSASVTLSRRTPAARR
jgi:hypothetical protein